MFTINLYDYSKNAWNEIAQVSGCEAAYEVYKKACEFAELVGMDCALVDAETGEIIANLEDED